MGKWELRCFFDPAALVVMPIVPTYLIPSHFAAIAITSDDVAKDFTQLGDPFNGILSASLADGELTLAKTEGEVWTVSQMVSNTVETNLATFQLRPDVIEELKSKYIERPLTFPVNFFLINRFAGRPSLAHCSHILSTTVNNCDTLFLLVPNTSNSLTCFYNPYILNFQLDAGPYGTYPSQPMNTFNSHRFINMVADALNVSNSVLTSFNKDTDTSFCHGVPQFNYLKDEANRKQIWTEEHTVGTRSNFFIAIPFSVDNDYQGGMSSPSSSIVFKVTGSGATDQPRHPPAIDSWDINWYACFLIDGSLMIKPDASGEAARVIYSERSIV
jgi:hypothetical protein